MRKVTSFFDGNIDHFGEKAITTNLKNNLVFNEQSEPLLL